MPETDTTPVEERLAAALLKHNVTFLGTIGGPGGSNLHCEHYTPEHTGLDLGYIAHGLLSGEIFPVTADVEEKYTRLPGFIEDIVEPMKQLIQETSGHDHEDPRWVPVYAASQAVFDKHNQW